jgi:hypothetical protein
MFLFRSCITAFVRNWLDFSFLTERTRIVPAPGEGVLDKQVVFSDNLFRAENRSRRSGLESG